MAGAKRPRLKRGNAARLLAELIDRARQLHGDDRHLFQVSKAIVFGDYLTDRDPIQDIDVAVALQPKQEPGEQRRLLDQQQVAEKDTLAALKGRSRGINLHRLEEWMLKRSHRVVLDE